MRIEKLKAFAETAVNNKHYQYKDVPQKDRMITAGKSFKKLTDEQQLQVQKSWQKFCNEKGIEFDIKDAIWYRYLAQTNLYFLCKMLEKYGATTDFTHEEMCNEFFVKKDPTVLSFEKFANAYPDLKDRMLLVPRGGFKSSIDIADCVQWIICFPEVTILILTGVYNLACDFVGELRGHFTLAETGELDEHNKVKYGARKLLDSETGEWSESLFQILFPEHCVKGEGKATEFSTPAIAVKDKEATVTAASIEQNLSGWHYGIMKLDDVVTNENSLTLTRLQAVNKQISINRAMLHPYGFFDVIGTWYDEYDYYGITIKAEEKAAEEDGIINGVTGSVDSGIFDSSINVKIYLRAAWWPNAEAKKKGKIEAEMTADDWDLWFPERLTYKFLLKEKKKDLEGFAIKYLNNPRKIHQIKFPRELLLRRTIPHHQLPQQGLIVATIDTAYSTKNWADYTVIIMALIYGGRFYIIDMVRGRFNEFELPTMIASSGYKWKPKRIAIEDSVGVKWMGRELRREMDKLGISIPVEYVSLGFGNKAKSKELKAKPVLRLLGDERMFFSNSCAGLEELYSELEKFGSDAAAHDDIVSALSILADQFAAYADMDAKINVVQELYVSDRQAKEKHDMVYGLGKYAALNSTCAIDDNPVTAFQVENSKQDFITDVDPLQDVFV